jgi:D-3-phosphoglycerate dehydrogenase
MINASPNLRVITMHGVGLNHIDSDTADGRGIVVKAVPGGNSEAVADLTWGLILAVSRKICMADSETRKGNWGKYFGHGVDHKTLGIMGFGFIGKAVARRALGFNMNVLAYDVFRDEETAANLHVTFVDKQTLLTTSDIITLHIPLLPQTRDFIGVDEFDLMKSTAILVNVSRGEIVDEAALIKALNDEKISGAGLDVFTEEPLPEGHPLTLAPNTVLTPHIGARTFETMRDIGIACAKNIISVISP